MRTTRCQASMNKEMNDMISVKIQKIVGPFVGAMLFVPLLGVSPAAARVEANPGVIMIPMAMGSTPPVQGTPQDLFSYPNLTPSDLTPEQKKQLATYRSEPTTQALA